MGFGGGVGGMACVMVWEFTEDNDKETVFLRWG